jgi:3-phenylpropionate/cinnamic acid dioxygenase small subunit
MNTPVEIEQGVRRTLGAIAQAADDGRIDDYLALFMPDAEWTVPSGSYVGRDSIRAVLDLINPVAPQRHLVFNSVIDTHGDAVAATSDFVFLIHEPSGWVTAAVGRYQDEFHHHDGRWLLSRREVVGQTPSAYMPSPEVDDQPF